MFRNLIAAICLTLFTSQYVLAAGSLTLMNIGGPTAVIPVSIVYNTATTQTGAGGSVTYSSQAVGTAAAGRIIIVALSKGDPVGLSGQFTAVTVNGNAATIATGATCNGTDSVGDGWRSTIYYIVEPVGTTANVVVTYSAGSNPPISLGLWSVYNASSTTPQFAQAAAFGSTNGSRAINTNVLVGTVGAFVAMRSSGTPAWTNATVRNLATKGSFADNLSAVTPTLTVTATNALCNVGAGWN